MHFREFWFPNILIGASAAAVGAVIFLLIRSGADVAAISGLLGGLIGAATAVGGAVWASDRTKRRGEERELSLLQNNFNELRGIASKALGYHPAQGHDWSTEFRDSTHEFGEYVRGSVLIVEQAESRSKELDFVHLAALRHLLDALRYAERWYQDITSEFELDPRDERNWRLILTETIDALDEALARLRAR